MKMDGEVTRNNNKEGEQEGNSKPGTKKTKKS